MIVFLSFSRFQLFDAFAFSDTDAEAGTDVIAKIVKEV